MRAAPEIIEIHLETGKKHQVENAHRAEKNDAGVPGQDVQAVRTDENIADNDADDTGEPDFAEQKRGKEDDKGDQGKDEDRVLDG